MRAGIVAILGVLLVGCGSNPIVTVDDPTQRSREVVPFDVTVPPLDLGQYKNPTFIVVEHEGRNLYAMPPEQARDIVDVYVELREYIRLQRQAIQEYNEYYERNVD